MFYQTPQHLEKIADDMRDQVEYQGLGFKKVRLDERIYQEILNHFQNNKQNFSREHVEEYLLTTRDDVPPSIHYQDQAFNRHINEALKPAHEEWFGKPLIGANCYGVRVYLKGSYLYSHVDKISTHVISSSICVDAQLDKPWPFYIEDIEGNSHELIMEPGEMVFYESAKLKHGRPYPLEGDYYVSMFAHYTPAGWKLK